MSYFAEIIDGVITNVIVADQEFIDSVEGNWVQTFEDASARFNYAVIGGSYDPEADAFIAARPACGHKELFLNDNFKWNCQGCELEIKRLRDEA
jgi:hypothetical protein